ncbi:MAG: glutamate synthase (ferredoxin) [Chloroflexi bacterium]|nr:MAG: glutamate synthase (ferredoxin) [Chloroflexota bacterium]
MAWSARVRDDATARGLYDPRFEHDACGVGVVANLTGKATHTIIDQAIEVLENLEHRGALGADPETGDGAGLLMEMPDALMRAEAASLGIALPPLGEYGVGMVFLPQDAEERAWCEAKIAETALAKGLRLLGWRDVPHDADAIGTGARSVLPVIRQCFLRGTDLEGDALERKLYVVRRVVENAVVASELEQSDQFYVSTLSCNRIVYKGLLITSQLGPFYADLRDARTVSRFALVHSRFSTNTMGAWALAHPYRLICHNGEINTLRGNVNAMTARQALMSSALFGDDLAELFPICLPDQSDTATFDNALELLVHTGRPLAQCLMMMIPEAFENHETMSQERRDFYDYHASLMEPWDGPAMVAATDGKQLAVVLDRNGLRPLRYTVTKDGVVVMGSETGVLEIAPERIERRGRVEPGRMFLIDMVEGCIVTDDEVKQGLAASRPYGQWLSEQRIGLDDLPEPEHVPGPNFTTLRDRQQTQGFTTEELVMLLAPMADAGKEPTGSMGDDTPLAVLSTQGQPLFNYFRQLFAQVTNPPLDAQWEALVTSTETLLGPRGNIFETTPGHAHQLKLSRPVITNRQLAQIKELDSGALQSATLSTLFRPAEGEGALEGALTELQSAAARAVDDGACVLVLSDRGVDADQAPIPSLLAVSAVHHHLISMGRRTQCDLVLESGEPRETHHFAVLVGYGAGAINPYLALESLHELQAQGEIDSALGAEALEERYLKAVDKGIIKVMSKMGISTVSAYRGAQIFEAIGLGADLVDSYFTGTASRIGGIGLEQIEAAVRQRHARAYPDREIPSLLELPVGGMYHWRRDGEYHMFNPQTIALLQEASSRDRYDIYQQFAALIDGEAAELCTIRGLLGFTPSEAIALDEVEPVSAIIKRFATGAISFGSISKEAHESLAIAMNRIGGKSNTGEGGEDPARYRPDANGDRRESAIKQVASGRFGVTSNYLTHASDIQIKMAQGAKPGEGGQLPGHKVDENIARVRHSTPGVELISPPPHHDIYSIEDLAELIHDLKNANPSARIHVKLVSEVGVGTIAAGVSKGHGDVVLISGASGGTGASPESSIKHAGLPWELGVAETQQVLVMNDLRSRIVVQTDGQLKTGRDVAIACLLGAEEFGFATGPLVTLGCIMLRKCHLNVCSVGIATQDAELRAQFRGDPQHVIHYFQFIAEHLREIMAALGFRTINEMVGRVDKLEPSRVLEHYKASGLDLSPILFRPEAPPTVGTFCSQAQDHGLEKALDNELVRLAQPALESQRAVQARLPIRNRNRAVGATLSHEISKRYGERGLPDETMRFDFRGSAGQSFGAFLAKGVQFALEGDANDYFGKGLSGGRLVARPPREATFVPEDNIIIGNVAFYGGTAGEAFVQGMAGERFAVRNSGVHAVVEGVGDHGCEYMTGGQVVVLGPTGRNFAAGMSGGLAYVLDEAGDFESRCNAEIVDLFPVEDREDIAVLLEAIERHMEFTGSDHARRILANFEALRPRFVKVFPRAYQRVLRERAEAAAAVTTEG